MRRYPLASVLALLLCAAPAFAADDALSETPGVTLRGFGTLGAVHASERNADFVGSSYQPNGAGATRRWAHTVDTKLGVQLDATFTEQLSGVVQVVAQQQYNNRYTPGIEWANLKYQVTPDFFVRAGRTLTSQFMLSDTRLVGYTIPWIRAPQEIYGLVPITNKDGIDAAWRVHFGDATNTFRASYGATQPKLPNGGRLRANSIFDVSSTFERGPMTLRASFSTADTDLQAAPLENLFTGLTRFAGAASAVPGGARAAAQARAIADRYRLQDEPITRLAFGAAYDKDEWLLLAEWAKFGGHSILADSTAWYVAAGYRIGPFTPYVTYARLTADPDPPPSVSTAGLPPALAASAAAANANVSRLVTGAAFAQHSVTIGTRWDFAKNTALKVQYDRVTIEGGSAGRLGNLPRDFQPTGPVHVFSVAVDFVF